MSKHKLYPTRSGDRGMFWFLVSLTLFGWFIRVVSYKSGELTEWYNWLVLLFAAPMMLVLLYVIHDLPKEGAEDAYIRVIANISNMGKQLSELAEFLKKEQMKVAESEATLKRLQDEQTQLEPVVATQRQTVNAILAANARTMAAKAWKERVLTFMSGVLASLLATMLFESLRR